ncbi:MAG: hypothetical protein ACP5I1_05065, partial [Candidatus Hinthialibacter sp.]
MIWIQMYDCKEGGEVKRCHDSRNKGDSCAKGFLIKYLQADLHETIAGVFHFSGRVAFLILENREGKMNKRKGFTLIE